MDTEPTLRERHESRKRLRAYLARHAPDPPPRWGTLPPPLTGTAADLPMEPGPQPWNGGITPGWEPLRGADEPATLGDVQRAADDVAAADEERRRRLSLETWDVGTWVAELERDLKAMRLELKAVRDELQRQGAGGKTSRAAG